MPDYYVIDIETRPNPRILADADYWARKAERLQPPKNYSNTLTIESWRREEIEKQRGQAALKPWLGLIMCIGIAPMDGDARVLVAPTEDEAGEECLLKAFESAMVADSARPSWVGWNIRKFDIPWLLARQAIQIQAPEPFLLPFPRDWARVVDLLEILGGEGKLDEWQQAFGFPPKDIDGAETLTVTIGELARHCRDDVLATLEIAKRTQGSWRRS